jgi:hypothetical protein
MALLQVVPRVLELLDTTCAKQFESLGCFIKSVDDDLSCIGSLEDFVSVSIQAQSDDLSLSLYLSVPGAFLRETMPLVDAQNSEIVQFQEDWCMELANRFLGRLKNKLISHRCVLMMGLPKLYVEGELALELDSKLTQSEHKCFERLFTIDSHLLGPVHDLPVVARLFIDLNNPELMLNDYEDEDEDWFDESELEHL